MLPLITCLLTLKDNYYVNYLTGAWISSFDPCISRGQIFGLIFRSWKVNLYTGKYGNNNNNNNNNNLPIYRAHIYIFWSIALYNHHKNCFIMPTTLSCSQSKRKINFKHLIASQISVGANLVGVNLLGCLFAIKIPF